MVTKLRVWYLVAKSEVELAEWIHVLSLRTMLHKENELLQKAEEMIATEARKQALEDEKKYLEAYSRRRKTTTTWSPRRLGSSGDVSIPSHSRGIIRMQSTPTVVA